MKKYIIYGLGLSGVSSIKFFFKKNKILSKNFDLIATDDNESAILKAKEDVEKILPKDLLGDISKIKFLKSDEIEFDRESTILFSPGIPLYFPTRHKILEICKNTGASLLCDVEFFYRNNYKNKFIGITGTNGKSTTTALTGFVFNKLNIPSKIGGNIGIPCLEIENLDEDFTNILEVSSYQLDLLSNTKFNIAALMNITPDHIDRHGSMDGYILAKKRIFRNQTSSDFAIIDFDNENSKKVMLELEQEKYAGKIIPISTSLINENGVSLIDGVLHNKINNENDIIPIKSEFLIGKHNEQNMAFAFAICYCSMMIDQKLDKNSANKIVDEIKKFTGLSHRMQIVKKIDNVSFVNDSKATNAESTKNALEAYNNIFWIVGGKAKEGGISNLSPYFKKIVKAYLIGEASDEFAKTLSSFSVSFEKCQNLENAFYKIIDDLKKVELLEKNVLLSPACASFDQWKNFEQRGDFFCKLVNEL